MTSDPITTPEQASGIVGFAQPVAAPLTRAAIFLVVTLKPGPEHRRTIRSFCGDLATVLRAVEFRDIEAGLSCVVGLWVRRVGPAVWHAAASGTPRFP